MGFISNKVKKSEIREGDHIYTYRARYTYAHHGIYVGDNKVIHFTGVANQSLVMKISSIASSKKGKCAASEDYCGSRQDESGVILSCLDCFLKNKDRLYVYEYGVSKTAFCAKVRGGSCTTAESDEPDAVIHRAMYLHNNGFRKYNLFENNCEDFALYCKTGLLDRFPTSGQVLSAASGAAALGVVSQLHNPVGATFALGIYAGVRLAKDIGVRKDVDKIQVEDLIDHKHA